MWFDGVGDVARVVTVGLAAYVALVVVLRVSGKRTLAKLNAFDLVVTVAFGSVLATALLNRAASLAEVATAFVVLAGAQFVVAALAVRVRSAGRLVRAHPAALVVRGQVDRSRLVAERVSMADLRAAVRQAGLTSFEDALAVVLETDGSLSIVPSGAHAGEALDDVRGWHPAPGGPDDEGARRATREVVEDHLARWRAGDLEGDLASNYADDVVLLSAHGLHRGHEGVRTLAGSLGRYTREDGCRHRQVLATGEVAMVRWTAEGPTAGLHDGADSYVVRDGRIVVQTTHPPTGEEQC